MAVNCQLKDSLHNNSSLVINQPVIFILWVFAVAVHAQIVRRQSAIALLSVASPHLLGLITQVHFVQHVHKGCKLAADGIDRIHAVTNGDEAHTFAAKIDLRVKPGLHIVTPNATQVLGNYNADQSRINIRNQLLPSGAFKVAAAVTVVCVMAAVREPFLLCVAL